MYDIGHWSPMCMCIPGQSCMPNGAVGRACQTGAVSHRIQKGGEGGRTSMKTVPFWDSPLQNCAGCVLLLTQSGCTRASSSVFSRPLITLMTPSLRRKRGPEGGQEERRQGNREGESEEGGGRTLISHRNGATPVPTTASWLSARSSVFLRIARSASLIVESCGASRCVRVGTDERRSASE